MCACVHVDQRPGEITGQTVGCWHVALFQHLSYCSTHPESFVGDVIVCLLTNCYDSRLLTLLDLLSIEISLSVLSDSKLPLLLDTACENGEDRLCV